MISIVNTECHVPKTFSDLAKIAAWGRLGQDLASKKSAAWEARSAAWGARPLQPCQTFRMTPSGLEIAPAATFPPPCPLGSIAALSAWLFWKANCDGAAGAVVSIEAGRLNDPQSSKKRAGEAGSSWGCRVGGSQSDPGRPKAASRRGRSPQEAALFFPLTGAGSAARVDHAASVPKIRTSCSIWRDAGG